MDITDTPDLAYYRNGRPHKIVLENWMEQYLENKKEEETKRVAEEKEEADRIAKEEEEAKRIALEAEETKEASEAET